MGNIVVIGPEGSGTHFIGMTIARMLDYPFYNLSAYHVTSNLRRPAVLHVSYPNGRYRDTSFNGIPNLMSKAWMSLEELKELSVNPFFLVSCKRRSRDAIRSAFNRFFTPEFMPPAQAGLEVAVNFHYVAVGLISQLPVDYTIQYEECLSDPARVFGEFITAYGYGTALKNYDVRAPSCRPNDEEINAKLKSLGVQ